MSHRPILATLAALVLAGCAVGNPKYPAGWEPLVPKITSDCSNFSGMYADRGDGPGYAGQASLTRELFGPHSGWESARRFHFAWDGPERLTVTVWDGTAELVTRAFSVADGTLQCDSGRLIVRSKRWVHEVLVAGHESVSIELSDAGDRLVAYVNEVTYGLIFIFVPIAADATHWYRFQRVTQ